MPERRKRKKEDEESPASNSRPRDHVPCDLPLCFNRWLGYKKLKQIILYSYNKRNGRFAVTTKMRTSRWLQADWGNGHKHWTNNNQNSSNNVNMNRSNNNNNDNGSCWKWQRQLEQKQQQQQQQRQLLEVAAITIVSTQVFILERRIPTFFRMKPSFQSSSFSKFKLIKVLIYNLFLRLNQECSADIWIVFKDRRLPSARGELTILDQTRNRFGGTA